MTEQINDICILDGREWLVEESYELNRIAPTNEQLGFSTIMTSTANLSGRIDHYLVFKHYLYLFKVEVSLPDDQRNLVPPGARREMRYLYDQVRVTGDDGMKIKEQVHERRYFIYDDLKIDYSGELVLLYPTGDEWEYLRPLQDDDLEPYLEATLVFHRGKLEGYEERSLTDDE